jgi:hypothetical protein
MALFDKDNAPLDDKEALQHHIETALEVPMPTGLEMEVTYQIVKRLFNPLILGAENIPRRPCTGTGIHQGTQPFRPGAG